MIYEHLRLQYPSLSLMTVYNTINTLIELGQVHALGDCGDNNIHYDANTSPHVHLACISCHHLMDIPAPQIEELRDEVSRASGYQLLGARMMFYGLCPACQPSNVL